MKNLYIITTLIIGLAIVFTSCQKVEKDPVFYASQSVAAKITTPETGIALTFLLADSANPFLVNWTAASYNVSDGVAIPVPTYSLQMDYADNNFGTMIELYNTQDLAFETITYKLNSTLLTFGIPGDSTAAIELRIISGISEVSNISDTSEIINMTVTPFTPPAPPPPSETPRLWVPGDYQGWNPGAAPNVWSVENDGKYTGYIYYPEGGTYEFKFTSAPDWDHTNFGAGEGEGVLITGNDAGNLTVPDFGGYVLSCDTIGLTWSYEIQNWGVIGSGILSGDWSVDEDLVYDATNNVLTVTMDVTESQDGDLRFKFRANDDWDVNLGQGAEGNQLAPGGPDILMPEGAGNYTFILDMNQEIPTYEFYKN